MCLDLWFAILLTIIGHGMVWPFWGTETILYGNGVGWDRNAVGDGAEE